MATAVWSYEHGDAGVILSRDPNLARQHPADYVKGAEVTIKKALAEAKKDVRGFKPEQVIGIGVDTTGSTPLPVDRQRAAAGVRQAVREEPGGDGVAVEGPHRRGRGGGDHRAGAEDSPAVPRQVRRHLFERMVLQQDSALPAHRAGGVRRRAYRGWNCADWVPAMLTGTEAPDKLTVGVCAAGHKAMYNDAWGGYPDAEFLAQLDPKLGELRARLCPQVRAVDRAVGGLTAEWAKRTGLPAGIPVAVGAFDAHLGGVGAGIAPGTLVKIIGTSTCDMMVVPRRREAGGHPRPVRHRQRQHSAGLLRPRSGPVGGGRHLQLVRQLHSARRQESRLARGAQPTAAAKLHAGRIRPAGAGLEQRQPHDPGGPAPHRPAARARRSTPRRRRSTARSSRRRRSAR